MQRRKAVGRTKYRTLLIDNNCVTGGWGLSENKATMNIHEWNQAGWLTDTGKLQSLWGYSEMPGKISFRIWGWEDPDVKL